MKKSIVFLFILSCVCLSHAQQLPYKNATLTARQRAEDLCSRLTLKEKINLMSNGSPVNDKWGIPHFEWWSEALHGVGRNGYATVFPITTAMASSWDDTLLCDVFDAVSDELRAKNTDARQHGNIKRYQGLSIWTPNINIFRDPRWGRGQETYGEDPYLTSKMGLAVVRGLQGAPDGKYLKTLACAKHFAVHSGPEWNRHSFNIENLPVRDLWETYLPAFKSLIQEGNVAEIMCAYQSIDGEPCCGNNHYLQQILRDELGFKGLVVSDCGAISDFWIKGRHEVSPNATSASAKALIAGTDVECGANYKRLDDAVKEGIISEKQIDTSVIRLLTARFMLGDFDPDEMVGWTRIPQSVVASKEHKALALKITQESMTLLQNKDNVLPLNKNMRIMVMGPNAADSIMLWGNYNGYPTSSVTILQGIRNKVKNVSYMAGCGYTRNEIMDSRFDEMYTSEGQKGMKATYWNNTEMSGIVTATQVMRQPINQSNGGATVFAPDVELENFSATYEGVFCPKRSEMIVFNTSSDDRMRVVVNSDTIINNWKSKNRIVSGSAEYKVEAGREYKVKVDYVQTSDVAVSQFDLGHKITLSDVDILAAVKNVDAVIYVGGISPLLEGEEMKVIEPGFRGGDRENIELPDAQRHILQILKSAGKKVIFVNCSGGAMALAPESNSCDAILQAWYPGEQGGTAVADVLFGDVNPSGHLPITFYKSSSQLPDFLNYTMKGRTYRYMTDIPLFPFGYGLSYTAYSIQKVKYDEKDGKLKVVIHNTGSKDGTAVIQVYISKPEDKEGPKKTLRAYKRINTKAWEKKNITIDLSRDSFEWWDAKSNTMCVVPGSYKIETGFYSSDPDMKVVNVNIK